MKEIGLSAHMSIIFLVIAFADASAEVIGSRYGRHFYRVPSLIPHQKHFRSLEGSLAFFLTSVVVLLIILPAFPSPWWVTYIFIPAALTLAEAKSPHSFDTPILIITYCLLVICIHHI
jgi:phytol kinase